jgi:hypothetical protein
MKRCDCCEHFDPKLPAEHPDMIVLAASGHRGGGECRRYPPRDEGHFNVARFRTVACDWWCGEFVPRKDVPALQARNLRSSSLTAGIPHVQ